MQIAEHWKKDDAYDRIVAALRESGIPLDRVTVEDLAPVDHFHARGVQATVELSELLPIRAGQHIVDIGCGLGGPARYIAQRTGCHVTGIDITQSLVDTARRLTALVGMESQIRIEHGDGQRLPFADAAFDGAYAQHVTMNVPDRPAFFSEAYRVLRPGAFFALTEHGLGPRGNPHHPVPWSADGTGEYLVPPSETRALLDNAGFVAVQIQDTGPKYLESYRKLIERAESGDLPPLGYHLLMGPSALQKTRMSARNIEEGRTHPIQVICRKPE